MVISFGYGDQILWLVYITVKNLDGNTQQSQK